MESVILGIICALLLILPFFVMYQSKQKSKKALEENFKKVIFSLNKKPGELDHCAGFLIGMDSDKSVVVLCRRKKDEISHEVVSIENLKQLRSNVSRIPDPTGGSNTTVSKVELLFDFIPNKIEGNQKSLTLYDAAVNFQLTGELELAEKWVNILNPKAVASLKA